jgi:hypothetical protein
MKFLRLSAVVFLAGEVGAMAFAAAAEPVKVGQAEIIRNEVVNVGDAPAGRLPLPSLRR